MAVQSAGVEHRLKVTRLVHMMRGGDRLKYAHEEFPKVSVIPRSMHEPWLLFRKRLDETIRDNLTKVEDGRAPAPGARRPVRRRGPVGAG